MNIYTIILILLLGVNEANAKTNVYTVIIDTTIESINKGAANVFIHTSKNNRKECRKIGEDRFSPKDLDE